MFARHVNSSLLREVESFYASFSFRQKPKYMILIDQVRYKEKYDFGIASTSQMKMDPIIESKSMRINIKVMVLVYDFERSNRNEL